MSASENQAAEASKGTDDRKVDPPRIKIHIRLPPRKRLSNGLITEKKEAPSDTNNAQSCRVPSQTKIKIARKKLTITAAQSHASSISSRVLCNEANNNTSSKTLPNELNCDISSDKLPEEANDSIPSQNLTITAAQCHASSISTSGLCNEANNNTWSKTISNEPNSDTSSDRLAEEANDSIPSKKLTITAVRSQASSISTRGLCNEANYNTLSKTLPNEPSCDTSSDKLPEEANDSIPSKNLTITAGMCGNNLSNCSAKEGLCEEANGNIPSNAQPAPIKELPAKPVESMPSKNLTTMAVLGEEENKNSLRLFHETNNNIPSKVVVPEKSKNNQGQNLTTTAMKCEEDNNNIPTRKLLDKTMNNTQSNRLIEPARRKNPQKKLCSSAVHAAHARQNKSQIKMANSEMKTSMSFGQAAEQGINVANLETIKQYQEFEEKVKRTVYLDYFSHQATEAVIKTALNQFGTVREINFLVNYTIPFSIPQSALVIMETEKDAVAVVNMLNEFPFMMSGMPRPVRATRATAEMFNDRPRRPGRDMSWRTWH
ncbi:hypothetical protein E2562_009251 [Oryza meyeriana var. granulata]|uniref:RRM domain-containing protein n=1 Tax=Oryza meyeriana var. granulata TaxID=110450 RepID=A0A6G1D1Q5_9ORYZ|nr:hypothetical protein E2562_009251 [Oryza meyeriana var. granulata]